MLIKSKRQSKRKKLNTSNKNPVLLVTGNGFDLACDLKTRYYDFMLYLIAKHSEVTNYFLNGDYPKIFRYYTNTKDVTIWEYYFFTEYSNEAAKDLEWLDIEEKMYESFKSNGFWKKVEDAFFEYQNVATNIGYRDNYPGKFDRFNVAANAFKNTYRDEICDKPLERVKHDAFMEKLLEELCHFESKFGEYLKLLNLDETYGEKKAALFNEIKKKIAEKIGQYKSPLVCTFNYTSVFDPFKINYIHGDINKPLFGINNDNASKRSELLKFTKQYRRKISNPPLPTYADILGSDQRYTLVFYGVSFSDSDAPDYKILFNHADFSHENAIIVCYSNWGDKDRLEENYNAIRNIALEEHLTDDFELLVQQNRVVFIEV